VNRETHRSAGTRPLRAAIAMALGLAAYLSIAAAGAYADGPGVGTPNVAALGDSYISGEAGRWAGNTANGEQYVDAGGPNAYNDTTAGPVIPGCDRSRSEEAYIGGGVAGVDFACSGARTSTFTDSSGNFKPGIDFYDDGSGHQGQAKMLQSWAATHNVKLVVLSIGGNNYNFADIVTDCVEDFLYSPSWWPDYCNDDSSVTANFTSSNITAQTTAIKNAILNVNTAMRNAGYSSSQWTLLLQDYPSPIPKGAGFRYSQSGYTRQSTGGCGFWNADADWANNSALPTIDNSVLNAGTQSGLTNLKTLEIRSAFNGRRLCENTVGRLEEAGVTYWNDPGAVDKIEWFQGIRTVTTYGTDYQIQESIHPDYLAQLALRNCIRQAYNGGTPRGGTCGISALGENSRGEPNMLLQ
jgi:hypothetical protein